MHLQCVNFDLEVFNLEVLVTWLDWLAIAGCPVSMASLQLFRSSGLHSELWWWLYFTLQLDPFVAWFL